MIAYLIAQDADEALDPVDTALGERGYAVNRLPSLAHLDVMGMSGGAALIVLLSSGDPDDITQTIAFAQKHAEQAYLIYISADIAAADFRRLLNTRAAEWVSRDNIEQDLAVAIANAPTATRNGENMSGGRFVAFVPAGGGVGNTTLALETAIDYASRTKSKEPDCCVLDLNLQQGNLCDLIDLEPRLDIEAIADDPQRLDFKLLEAFRSRSKHGIDIYELPKFTQRPEHITADAVFALCNILSARYSRVHADLPSYLLPWMFDIIANSDRVVMTCGFSVPAALRIQALRGQMRGVDQARLCVVVNRYQDSFLKKSLPKKNFEESIKAEKIIYIRDDYAFASECCNMGTPMMVAGSSRGVCKDMRQIEGFIDPSGDTRSFLARAFSIRGV